MLKYIDKDSFENTRNYNLLKTRFNKLKHFSRTVYGFK